MDGYHPGFVADWLQSIDPACPSSGPCYSERRPFMLETIAIILIVLWLLGFVSSYTMGGFIHALLVVAIVMILVQGIQGRRVYRS